ncbi:MAG: efflux RND transporter periplasmic adaptor subunit [Xanthobacteraceae bacterium]|nr:efflux RND transporter periplasmic adaptor subunit [Xanthobacteraceae bacterium]QYK45910.1 MAG: efflux RND transporter periplasmic adaptor subunit [Xanthobacteraceae bacterium]HMN50859.1 efflux RND transporter periplasmic adaptor subunit [Xanthobacteraceae bacterium]
MKSALPTNFSMPKRRVLWIAGAAAILLIGGWWSFGGGTGSSAQQKKKGPAAISISAAQAKRMDVPYRVESLGTVQPLVTVSIRSRVDSQVLKVHFTDGAKVNEGDLLFTLDARAIDAQIQQAEATLLRDKAQLEKAERDRERIIGLAAKGTLSQVQEADAKTNVAVLKATVAQDEANLQNLRVMRTYYDVKAPVSGRMSVANVRQGAIVRSADAGTPLATINQLSPIYVAFGVPERFIPDLRAAGEKAAVEVALQNEYSLSGGRVAFIENAVDSQTGTILVRATFENADERLWPGTLASVRVTLKTDPNLVVVPAEAIQVGQRGNFVFVIENNVARVRNVKVLRTQDGFAALTEGLNGDETVVTDGQLSLRDGSRVDIKKPAGS